MVELVGLLLGVTGPVQQVVEILKDLKERRTAVRTHKPMLESLYIRYAQLSGTLNGIQEAKIEGVSDNATRLQLQAMMEHVKEVVVGTVTSMEEVQRYAASRFNRFRSAKKHAELIKTVDRDAKDCDRYVSDILLLLAQADTHRVVLDLQAGTSADTASHNASMFRASFAVSKNDRVVYHDFESRRPDGAFETTEGRLKDLIMSSTDDRSVGAVAVGTGGVGKTCALLEITQRADVRARFPGGTYFYRLGKDARKEDVVSMLADFVRSSNGRSLAIKMTAEGDLHAVISDACNWFNGKVCLFVVDDIWETADMPRSVIQNLSRLGGSASSGGAGSRIAYSTRQTEVSDAAGGSTVRFAPREPLGNTARSMLFKAAQFDYYHAYDVRLKSFVDDILRFCAGLPFTLNLAGRLICKLHREWGSEIRVETFKICAEKLRGNGILNLRGESYFKVIQISIDHLESIHGDEISYTDAVESFCVLRKQDWVPISVCRHMWRIPSLSYAEKMTDILLTLGIVETEYRKIKERSVRGLRFHDHVHSYALWLAERSPDKMRWFKHVVHSYKTSFGALPDGVCWPAMLEEDGYVVQNICRIMLGAGLADEVAKTLCTGQWVTKMMHIGHVLQYDKDVKDWEGYVEGSGTTSNDEVRSTLSSLAKIIRLGHPDCVENPHVAWFQLFARLRSVHTPKMWMETIMREAKRHAPRPFVQARSACLHFPSDALLDIYHFECPIRYARWLRDGTLAVCAFDNFSFYMIAAFCKPGMPPIEKELRKVDNIYGLITAACLSSNGTIVYSGHQDGTIYTWDVTTGDKISTWQERHEGMINSICICSDESRVASGSDDCTARVWDVASGAPMCDALTGHDGVVFSVCLSGDGLRVATGSSDCTVRVWDVASGAPMCDALTGHNNWVRSVSMSEDGLRVASGSNDRTVRVWDVASGSQICEALSGHKDSVQIVRMSGDGMFVASGSSDCTVRVWSVSSGLPVCNALSGHVDGILSMSISHDGSCVSSGAMDGTVRVWDVASGVPACDALTGHDNGVISMSMSGDGSCITSGAMDGTVRVWDVASGAPLGDALTDHDGVVMSVCMSANGSRVASGADDCTVRVWDVSSGALVCDPLTDHDGEVLSVSLSGDGLRVASGSSDCTVRVWDVASGALVCDALTAHNGEVLSVSMSGDGSRVASGGKDCTVRVWDVSSGALVCDALTGHNDRVTRVDMSGDGNRLVSVSDDRTLRLWTTVRGICEKVMHYEDNARSRSEADTAARNFLCGHTLPAVKIADDFKSLVVQAGDPLAVATFEDLISAFCVSDDGTQVVAGFGNGVVAFLHVLM